TAEVRMAPESNWYHALRPPLSRWKSHRIATPALTTNCNQYGDSMHNKFRSRVLLGIAFTSAAIIACAMAGMFGIFAATGVTIPANYFIIIDQQGPNDENGGQKDLSQMGRKDTNDGFLDFFWSWDQQGTTGNNTLTACALFDSDGDTFI